MELISGWEDKFFRMRPFQSARTHNRRRRTPNLIVGTVVLHHKHTELFSRITCLECLRIIKTNIYLLMRFPHINVGIGEYGGRDIGNIFIHHKTRRDNRVLRLIIDYVKLIVTAYLRRTR